MLLLNIELLSGQNNLFPYEVNKKSSLEKIPKWLIFHIIPMLTSIKKQLLSTMSFV
jgi:hypothetical protein